MIRLRRILWLMSTALLAGCSTDNITQTAYSALEHQRHKNCLKQLDPQSCDEQKISYEEYRLERERHRQTE
jgi:hypothetical protein